MRYFAWFYCTNFEYLSEDLEVGNSLRIWLLLCLWRGFWSGFWQFVSRLWMPSYIVDYYQLDRKYSNCEKIKKVSKFLISVLVLFFHGLCIIIKTFQVSIQANSWAYVLVENSWLTCLACKSFWAQLCPMVLLLHQHW